MSSSPTRPVVLTLYKIMLREAAKFPDFNFRSYSVRRIRDAFRESRSLASLNQVIVNGFSRNIGTVIVKIIKDKVLLTVLNLISKFC